MLAKITIIEIFIRRYQDILVSFNILNDQINYSIMKFLYTFILKTILIVIVSTFSQNVCKGQEIEFNTDGLYYAEFFDNIFRGHFENVEMNWPTVPKLSACR